MDIIAIMNVQIFKMINRFLLSPYLLQVLRVHQVISVSRQQRQSEALKSISVELKKETLKTFLAALKGWDSFPKVQRFLA
jgi:hypothetical protein